MLINYISNHYRYKKKLLLRCIHRFKSDISNTFTFYKYNILHSKNKYGLTFSAAECNNDNSLSYFQKDRVNISNNQPMNIGLGRAYSIIYSIPFSVRTLYKLFQNALFLFITVALLLQLTKCQSYMTANRCAGG